METNIWPLCRATGSGERIARGGEIIPSDGKMKSGRGVFIRQTDGLDIAAEHCRPDAGEIDVTPLGFIMSPTSLSITGVALISRRHKKCMTTGPLITATSLKYTRF